MSHLFNRSPNTGGSARSAGPSNAVTRAGTITTNIAQPFTSGYSEPPPTYQAAMQDVEVPGDTTQRSLFQLRRPEDYHKAFWTSASSRESALHYARGPTIGLVRTRDLTRTATHERFVSSLNPRTCLPPEPQSIHSAMEIFPWLIFVTNAPEISADRSAAQSVMGLYELCNDPRSTRADLEEAMHALTLENEESRIKWRVESLDDAAELVSNKVVTDLSAHTPAVSALLPGEPLIAVVPGVKTSNFYVHPAYEGIGQHPSVAPILGHLCTRGERQFRFHA